MRLAPFGNLVAFAFLILFAPQSARGLNAGLNVGLNVRRAGWVPEDTAPPATYEGPDMIPLFNAGHVPGPIPAKDAAPEAKSRQILIDNVMCHVNYPQGNVYLVTEPALKPYLQNTTSGPAIIIAPGGGNGFLAWQREGTEAAEWLASLGINAFVLKYRVPSDGNSDLGDAQQAISFVRRNAKKFGIDSKRVGFMGFSAGGIMTSDVSLTNDLIYQDVNEADDVDHHPDLALLIYGMGPSKITEDMHRPPPTFMANAADDTCVSPAQAQAYCNAIRAINITCDGHLYPNGGHGYGTCSIYTNAWSGDSVCDWTNKAKAFLQTFGWLSAA